MRSIWARGNLSEIHPCRALQRSRPACAIGRERRNGGSAHARQAVILAEHNNYRTAVGAPPLAWSDKLASGAQLWADAIALLGQVKHSGTSGVGENLAYWRGSNASLSTMIGDVGTGGAPLPTWTFPHVPATGTGYPSRTARRSCGAVPRRWAAESAATAKSIFWSASTILRAIHRPNALLMRGILIKSSRRS